MNSTENIIIRLEGIVSVSAAIESGFRTILKVYIDLEKYKKRDRKITRFLSLIKDKNIQYELCSRDYINSLAEGTSHGGVVADVSEREYLTVLNLIESLKDNEYLVMLDGVEDPFNFGYSIRNLYAFGCKGFIIPKRNWMSSANIVAKSSAGASELCRMAVSEGDDSLIDLLKENGVEIICSALSSTSVPLFDFKPNKPFVLFIGGEKRGISTEIMENADKVVHIPYSCENAKYSLPTASCAAIFGSYISSIK